MAKKKKSDGKNADKKSKSKESPKGPGAAWLKKIDALYAQGNFAGVKALANAAPEGATDEEIAAAEKSKSLVTLDPVQLGVGLGAVALASLVALLTLVH